MKTVLNQFQITDDVSSKLLKKWKIKNKLNRLVQEIFSVKNVKKDAFVIKQVKILGIRFKFPNKYRNLLYQFSELKEQNTKLNQTLEILTKELMNFVEIPENIEDTQITTDNKDKNILFALKNLGKFYFLPNKGNLGDIMIASSEYQYFDSHNFKYEIYDMLKQNTYTTPFNFVYGGGGIWNKVYYREHPEILNIFRSKLLKKCVILSSSFNECDEVVKTFDERFTVFCRDERSYDYCKSINTKANFIIADDMGIGTNLDMYKELIFNRENITHFLLYLSLEKSQKLFELYQRYYLEKSEALQKLNMIKDYHVGFLLREDNEQNVQLNSHVKSMDLSAYLCGYGCDKGYSYICAKFFLEVIDQFNIIVTNRLHVGICAAKLGKEVLLLDISTYKKAEGVYKQSLYKFKNVHMTSYETLDDDLTLLLTKKYQHTQKDNFEVNTFNDFMLQYASFKNEYGIEKRFLKIRQD